MTGAYSITTFPVDNVTMVHLVRLTIRTMPSLRVDCRIPSDR